MNAPPPKPLRDLSGLRFGRLAVLDRAPNAPDRKRARWHCRCDCGADVILRSDVLTSGSAHSCGCARGTFIGAAVRRHGYSGTPTYQTWINLVRRCTNPNVKAFADYGARGVRVCERWHKFENFLEDMGPRPDGLWIERIDNNGHYEPGNCRWASPKEQARNRRRTRFVSLHGEVMPFTEAAERLGISENSLRSRVRRGKPVEGLAV